MEYNFDSIGSIQSALNKHRYIADRTLATSLFLAWKLGKPLLLEGEPGVGKTQLAQVLADLVDTQLIRLQCFEGIDSNGALYEWNYPKQLMDLKIQELRATDSARIETDIFSSDYLLKRPLLEAIQPTNGESQPVLLIDEIDRADEEFEAFLLEVLSDFQISIPELGTIKAKVRPIVILTSNGTREIHGALKRRCLYHWIDYPSPEREMAILVTCVPNIGDRLAAQICSFIDCMRQEAFYKKPGISETIDWAESLLALDILELETDLIATTAGCLLKNKRDLDMFGIDKIDSLLSQVDQLSDSNENPTRP
jgi:MoxR-like ATPase